jgi:hypothetical protein
MAVSQLPFLGLLQEAAPSHRNSAAFCNVALAIQAQAEARSGKTEEAQKTLDKARATLRKGKADFATVALAKAELMNGHEAAGLTLLSSAVSADHENPRIKQLVSSTLRETGHEDKIHEIVEAGSAALEAQVKDARKMFRDSKIDDVVDTVERSVQDYPENTGMLLLAAQVNCMALRLKKEHNKAMIDRVEIYLTRLEALMPSHDRVVQMRRYFRETKNELKALPAGL